jgi:WhiB family transcriptional regulator, redox-sensing transcriptional regulator
VNWRVQAACSEPGVQSEWFFPLPLDHETRAKALAICAGCPVVRECGEFAGRHDTRTGIWAGLDYSMLPGRQPAGAVAS